MTGEKFLHRLKVTRAWDMGWDEKLICIWVSEKLICICLTVPSPLYSTAQILKLFILYHKKLRVMGRRTQDPSMLSQVCCLSWPLKFSSSSFQPKSILLFCLSLPYHTHSGILRKPDGIYRKPGQHHRNQDSDALQLEWRCVENTKQMFGLRTQNNMYLTLQFKKLNSNMCLVGFPENIESCCIKLNKHQAQLVFPFFFSPFYILFYFFKVSLLPN